MNSRKPIYAMLAVGLALVITLTLVPYSLTLQRWKQRVVSTFTSQAEPVNASTSRPTAPPAFDVAAWYVARDETPEEHGVLIESFDGQRTLAAHNADVEFNPASLIKLATSLVALKTLGADFRFQTRVFLEGKVDGKGILQGRLYVAGHDPTFGDYGANLIAEELRARGIKGISETLVVSPDFIFNFSDKPEESAARLSKALKLTKPPEVSVTADASGGELLLTLNSNPLSDVLLYMNARSSNFIAEKLGALIGGASGVEQYLTGELKLPAAQVTVATVAGREHNRMTPRGLLTVIRALIEEGKRQGLEPADILPVVSDDAGTLRRRFVGTSLERAVVGKTGTLTAEVDGGMASLAGIVFTTDGPIVFVILDQGNRISDNRQLEDQLLVEVINGQTTPQAITGPTPRRLLPSANIQKQ